MGGPVHGQLTGEGAGPGQLAGYPDTGAMTDAMKVVDKITGKKRYGNDRAYTQEVNNKITAMGDDHFQITVSG